jgi:hypothetical protein
MRIEDLETINKDLPFNVVEDMAIFMRNDPMFYRKSFFPAVMRMKDCHTKGKKFDAVKEFAPMIEKATADYCKKFKIERHPSDLMDEKEKKNLIRKLYSEEMTQIRKGAY